MGGVVRSSRRMQQQLLGNKLPSQHRPRRATHDCRLISRVPCRRRRAHPHRSSRPSTSRPIRKSHGRKRKGMGSGRVDRVRRRPPRRRRRRRRGRKGFRFLQCSPRRRRMLPRTPPLLDRPLGRCRTWWWAVPPTGSLPRTASDGPPNPRTSDSTRPRRNPTRRSPS